LNHDNIILVQLIHKGCGLYANLASCIAYANDCILATNNPVHFERIDELKIENWLEK